MDESLGYFGVWLVIFLGLLWVKRKTGLLRCNVFSAAIAAVLYMAIGAGFYYPTTLHDGSSDLLVIASFLFITVGLIPLSSFLTLLIGKVAIPFFKVEITDIQKCTIYLSLWLLVALYLYSLLKFLAFLVLGAGFGRGMPRMRNDEYYF